MYKDEYIRHAVVIRIVDGDSVEAEIDLGFEKLRTTRNIRIYGINAPEPKGETRMAGEAASEHLFSLIPPGTRIITQTLNQKDKFGRYLARIYCGEVDIAAEMVKAGYAVTYLT